MDPRLFVQGVQSGADTGAGGSEQRRVEEHASGVVKPAMMSEEADDDGPRRTANPIAAPFLSESRSRRWTAGEMSPRFKSRRSPSICRASVDADRSTIRPRSLRPSLSVTVTESP